MGEEKLLTLVEYLYEREKSDPHHVVLKQPVNGEYKEFSWKETMAQAKKMAAFLSSLGLQKGDRVSILSKNCAEWVIAHYAAALAGMVNVPFYPNQSAEAVAYILDHAEVKVIFVGKLDNWQALEPSLPPHVIRIDFPYENQMPAQYHWNDIIASTPEPGEISHRPDLDETYAIIYTSGTTGDPKGAVYTFRGIAYHGQSSEESRAKYPHVFPPVSHALAISPFGHCMGLQDLWSITRVQKATIWFVESIATFMKNLQDAQPTVFGTVPRMWTQFQKGILAKIPQEKLDRLLKIPVVSTLVKRKIRKSLGLSRAKFVVSAAAPLSNELSDWYAKLGIHLVQGYGQTENLAIATVGIPGEYKAGTAGKLRPFVEIKISDEGEVLTRSPSVMSEYYKNPEATKAAFTEDGFLRTGDMGHFDEDGFLHIHGRFKDPFKTDKGEFVNPVPIEGKFLRNEYIEQLCVIGISLVQPVLLVVLSAAGHALSKEEISKSLQKTLDEVNAGLRPFEHISLIVVVKEPWTPENDLMTPTLKVKRNNVHKRYIDEVRKHVSGSDVVIFE